MSGRGLSAQFLSNTSAAHVVLFTLVEMRLGSGTLYLTDCPHSVDWNGITWLSAYGISAIGEISETAAEAKGLTFTLSATNDSLLAAALNEAVQGRIVIMRLATLTTATLALAVDENMWRGTLDVMTIERGESNSSITVTAEHMLANWDRPNLLLHSHEDQQRLYPGDDFYKFAASLAEASIVWPADTFFHK